MSDGLFAPVSVVPLLLSDINVRQPRYEVSDWFDILSNQHYGKSLKQYLTSSFVPQLDGHTKFHHIQFALLWLEGVNKMEWVLVLDKGAYISCKENNTAMFCCFFLLAVGEITINQLSGQSFY